MGEDEAKKLLESLKELQEDNTEIPFPCPRCGHKMQTPVVRNALSRYADVYICSVCGFDEAVRYMEEQVPLPLNKWAMILSFDE